MAAQLPPDLNRLFLIGGLEIGGLGLAVTAPPYLLG